MPKDFPRAFDEYILKKQWVDRGRKGEPSASTDFSWIPGHLKVRRWIPHLTAHPQAPRYTQELCGVINITSRKWRARLDAGVVPGPIRIGHHKFGVTFWRDLIKNDLASFLP